MMFILAIVFLATATEALYYVKILSCNVGLECEVYEIITFDKPSVSGKDVWNKVNKSEYVTYREKNGKQNEHLSVQVITPGKSEKIDAKTKITKMVDVENAEIVLQFLHKLYVATILDVESNMLLGHFTHWGKTAKVQQIWEDAEIHSRKFNQSIWKSVTEIRVETPGHPTQKITKQTTEDTVVQVENTKFLVKVEAVESVAHVAQFWKAELHTEGPYKFHENKGLFRFHATHMSVQDIWAAVEQGVTFGNNQTVKVILEELRIEMAKGTKSLEVKLQDEKDNATKIDVTTITDVIIDVRDTMAANNSD